MSLPDDLLGQQYISTHPILATQPGTSLDLPKLAVKYRAEMARLKPKKDTDPTM